MSAVQTNGHHLPPSLTSPYCLPLLKQPPAVSEAKSMQNLALHVWKEGTRKTCRCCILQWMMYCKYHLFDPYEPSVSNVTNFLCLLLGDGASYITVNIAWCALSVVLDTGSSETIGSDHMVSLVVENDGVKLETFSSSSVSEVDFATFVLYSPERANDLENEHFWFEIHRVWC